MVTRDHAFDSDWGEIVGKENSLWRGGRWARLFGYFSFRADFDQSSLVRVTFVQSLSPQENRLVIQLECRCFLRLISCSQAAGSVFWSQWDGQNGGSICVLDWKCWRDADLSCPVCRWAFRIPGSGGDSLTTESEANNQKLMFMSIFAAAYDPVPVAQTQNRWILVLVRPQVVRFRSR